MIYILAVFYEDEGRKPPDLKFAAHSFYLRDPEFGVAFEGFKIDEVTQGSVVEVRDPILEGEVRAVQVDILRLTPHVESARVSPP